MNARNIVIAVTVLSCLALSVVLYLNLGTEGVFWLFLYGVFAQVALAVILFSCGAFLSRNRSSQAGPGMMTGGVASFLIIICYWILAIGALSIYRAL